MVNIKVAVRIRPMSNRERSQRDSVIVSNSEKCILVTNPKMPEKNDGADSRQRTKRFPVDYCYDSQYTELANQKAVFEEIGTEVLGHMFEGYNACVLAYGHSASGKTYTMMGTLNDPGLTPRICRELSGRMRTKAETSYHVTVSFLEIYNEKVRDLLADEEFSQPPLYSLRVREHPKLGPYVQDLSEHEVEAEEDLLGLLNLGNSRRSTAATESNLQSSRSHAVFTIRFKQVGDHTAKSSKVHLVDLAGSERASTIQSRARLKEGAKINKSLVTLGNVISALAESCEPTSCKGWLPFVPYRDSVLTWLLKDTLGGNSNTIMIATISPASSCYSDTINTLRYAKRTKRIVNQPMINEDPKIRTIRELRDEISRLKAMLLTYSSQQTDAATAAGMSVSGEAGCSSKWQDWQGPRVSLCAVGLQTDDVDYLPQRCTAQEVNMETSQPPDHLIGHLAANPISCGHLRSRQNCQEVRRNIATLDILPTTLANKQNSCGRVGEINAENEPGVNRVIADPTRVHEWRKQKASISGAVPRVGWSPFKRKRSFIRRSTPCWSMLHRSRPDLIKGIATRAVDTPPTSNQGLAEALSQSTSDNSLHSSGSADFRPRLQAAASLSRTSSVGEASGSSTPPQPVRPAARKKENKRSEIVASVTSRLYAIKKKPDARLEALRVTEKEDEEDDDIEELKLCKRARMKLFDLSRKLAMAKKVKRTVDSDTQTEVQRSTLRVKEKSVATDQQGILKVQTCATNTSTDNCFPESESPVVMNQVFLPGTGSFVLECGSNFRVEVPCLPRSDSSCQTNPEIRDQTTSPKRLILGEDFYSDDSLESEPSASFCSNNVSLVKRNVGIKFRSCEELDKNVVSIHNTQVRYNSHPSLPFDKPSVKGVRVEKSLNPISRYTINGTNAFYEYDPNKSMPDKVIYSNEGEAFYGIHGAPKVIYPQYQVELFNGLPMGSSETVTSSDEALSQSKSLLQECTEDNLSSGTSSASTGSSIGASDTSSDDFVFVESLVPSRQNRELYTISENSEPGSNRSSPVSTQSPRLETITENDGKEPVQCEGSGISEVNTAEMKKDSFYKDKCEDKPKKVNWAQMECSGSNKFINFNYRPSSLNEKPRQESSDGLFPSEDSITFVFLGGKEQHTSVLMEVVKRSLLGGSDPADLSSRELRSRRRHDPRSSKLMRSVSVDTAMIALSRLARHQRPATGMLRSGSVSVVSSEGPQVEPEYKLSASGMQHSIKEKVNSSCEIKPAESGCQCELEKNLTYSLGTCTTTDRETETDKEQKECTTQTDLESFDKEGPELPRDTINSILSQTNSCQEQVKTLEGHWIEMKQLILGTGRDLFPTYLETEETKRPTINGPRGVRKTVSWSDLSRKVDSTSDTETPNGGNLSFNGGGSLQRRRVRFSEPHSKFTSHRRKPTTSETIVEFLRKATVLLQNLETSNTSVSSDSEETESSPTEKQNRSGSSLLRRRKFLSEIEASRDSPPHVSGTESQADNEKVNRCVKTVGLASGLVGSPLRRSLTPNRPREPFEENYTWHSTWPRRRIVAKPPTGLKTNVSLRSSTPVRSGSASSRNSSASWNLPSPSAPGSSPPLTPPTWVRYSPEPNVNQLQLTCRRLEAAIQYDIERQKNLANCLRLCFKDEGPITRSSKVSQYDSTPKLKHSPSNSPEILSRVLKKQEAIAYKNNVHNQCFSVKKLDNCIGGYNPDTKLMNNIQNISQNQVLNSNDEFPKSLRLDVSRGVSDPSYNSPTFPLKSVFQKSNRNSTKPRENESISHLSNSNEQSFETPQTFLQTRNGFSRSVIPGDVEQKISCQCTCHSPHFSYGDVIPGERHCHTCCVPCSSENKRPYSSEPSLTSHCNCHPSSRNRSSPSVHLRNLIALRRSIVAAQKESY